MEDNLWHDIIDRDIKIDVSILPKSVQEEIKELERLHEEKDWFNYDLKFDELEMRAKGFVIEIRNIFY